MRPSRESLGAGWRRVGVVIFLLAALSIFAAPASAKVFADGVLHQRFGVIPAIGAQGGVQQASCTTDCSTLTYHGGPVQHAESDYLLFWDPSGYTLPASYVTGMQTWLSDVAAADGTKSNPFSVNTDYYDNSGPGGAASYVPYAIQNAGAINDTDPYPSSGCTDHAYGSATNFPVCLTEAQIVSELQSYISAHGLPTGQNVEYFVLTPQNVGSCFDGTSSSCAYTGYCGWHSYSGSGPGEIVFADMPWSYNVNGCDVQLAFGAGYPNPNYIDSVVGVFSHELSETMTDPNLNAWFDGSGNEIGDKCAYTYGGGGYGSHTGLNNNGSGYWNVALGGDHYLLQQEFDNTIDNCVTSLTTTWTGTSGGNWSTGGNWDGQLSPLLAVNTLSFPSLSGGSYTANNDLSGLSAYHMSIDDGVGYSVGGNSMTLGAGGLTATTSAGSPSASTLSLPIALSGNQTWTVNGGQLNVGGAISGSSGTSLTTNLSNQGALSLGSSYEIGPVSVTGANSGDTGANASQNGTVSFTDLNAEDASAVTLTDAALASPAGTTGAIGALTSAGGSLQVGAGGASAGGLTVNGALSLDPASQLKLFIDGPGTNAVTDFSQVNATGNVNLGGALILTSGGACPGLGLGDVDTLITTTGTLSGAFAGIPNGQVVALNCSGSAPFLRINYTATSVTATVVSVTPPTNVSPPTVAGQATQGQMLSASHGSWSTLPTAYGYQWQDCNSSGASCSAIAGATNAWYILGASDVGHTIRVQETASNAAGTSSPATSAATVVVTAPASGGGGGGTSGGGGSSGSGGGGSSGGGGTSGSGGAPPAQIAFDLLRMLTPGAHVAKIGQVASASGYTYSFTARRTGTLVISWSYLAKAAHHKRVPVLVATIRVTFAKTGTYRVTVRLTKAGKRLLRRAKRIKLTAVATFTSAGLRPIVLHQTFTLVR